VTWKPSLLYSFNAVVLPCTTLVTQIALSVPAFRLCSRIVDHDAESDPFSVFLREYITPGVGEDTLGRAAHLAKGGDDFYRPRSGKLPDLPSAPPRGMDMIDVGRHNSVPLFPFSADCGVRRKVSNSILRGPALY
jgi:hypothetical protein